MRAVDLVDVLVYLVVLGLFVQFFPEVVTESFAISLLTAVLLKVALEVVVAAKTWALARLRAAQSAVATAIAAVTVVLVLPGSKLFVLWLTELVFGDAVHLGSFLQATLLIVVLMLARAGVRRTIVGTADVVRVPDTSRRALSPRERAVSARRTRRR